eukprot:GHVT01023732.1.p1 GENE.GHVT01023732.1~~GHVT01023732.1.p1  ORF type:complete len:487 (+),score=56.19 GHVT01023732.1:5699-7159(+)
MQLFMPVGVRFGLLVALGTVVHCTFVVGNAPINGLDPTPPRGTSRAEDDGLLASPENHEITNKYDNSYTANSVLKPDLGQEKPSIDNVDPASTSSLLDQAVRIQTPNSLPSSSETIAPLYYPISSNAILEPQEFDQVLDTDILASEPSRYPPPYTTPHSSAEQIVGSLPSATITVEEMETQLTQLQKDKALLLEAKREFDSLPAETQATMPSALTDRFSSVTAEVEAIDLAEASLIKELEEARQQNSEDQGDTQSEPPPAPLGPVSPQADGVLDVNPGIPLPFLQTGQVLPSLPLLDIPSAERRALLCRVRWGELSRGDRFRLVVNLRQQIEAMQNSLDSLDGVGDMVMSVDARKKVDDLRKKYEEKKKLLRVVRYVLEHKAVQLQRRKQELAQNTREKVRSFAQPTQTTFITKLQSNYTCTVKFLDFKHQTSSLISANFYCHSLLQFAVLSACCFPYFGPLFLHAATMVWLLESATLQFSGVWVA